ncbi:hypothetical protein [Desulfocicer vacuolatum]|nr:hypothetical protein [Desulfocicer vacuolatum]
MKDLVFNELTEFPLAADFREAYQRVTQFLQTYKARPVIFDKRIRLENHIGELQLTDSISLQDFCKNPKGRTVGALLLGLGRHPFIDPNTPEEDLYLEKSYKLNHHGDKKEAIGLASAYLNDTVCIGFESESFWKQIEHGLEISDNGLGSNFETVLSVSNSHHFKLQVFQEWIEFHQPVYLIKTTLEINEKRISLRHDHGKDVLLKFSNRLTKSPYITEIVNSLPFNPKCRNFIKSTDANGLIEIVLPHTDQGLGLIVQTTGRNIRETEKIAEILEKQFS